jgi:uncharacterized protein YdeI (YjbR/CyaY-like superfamily)
MVYPKARFFNSPRAFRVWLERNHAKAGELVVGFHKRHTGKPSLTWPESVDEALCFGWIDGVRHRLDEDRYTIRFTPRKATSIWSAVNTKRVAVLTKEGRMRAAGLKAFRTRDKKKSRIYSYERDAATMPEEFLDRIRSNARAWVYWEGRPPGFKKQVTHWVTSAKQEATRVRRLESLIASSAQGKKPSPYI